MKKLAIPALLSIATLIIGLYLGAKYIGQGEVAIALCVMGDVAMNEGHLTKQQLLDLSVKTGHKLKADYPLLAKSISLSNQQVSNASENSTCSQILVALTKGAQ